jgi:hypothetical protein
MGNFLKETRFDLETGREIVYKFGDVRFLRLMKCQREF